MYHFFVKQRVRKIFHHLNSGDYDFIVRQFAPKAEHWFSGKHALSGCRTTSEGIEEWYKRLAAVFPGIQFDILKIIVMGMPWKTFVTVEWKDKVADRNGTPLPNQGVFIITLKWGKATEFHVYCDTAQIEKNLNILATQGIAEAVASPIET